MQIILCILFLNSKLKDLMRAVYLLLTPSPVNVNLAKEFTLFQLCQKKNNPRQKCTILCILHSVQFIHCLVCTIDWLILASATTLFERLILLSSTIKIVTTPTQLKLQHNLIYPI